MRTLTADAVAHLYLLGIGLLLFVWPNVLALSSVPLRIGWVLFSCALILLSTHAVRCALRGTACSPTGWGALPWEAMVAVGLPIALTALTTPITSASGEFLLALLGLTAASKILSVMPWPIVTTGILSTALLLWWEGHRLASRKLTTILFLPLPITALTIALGTTQVVSSRYPPLLDTMQLVTALLSQGHYWTYRLPTVLWSVLAVAAIWRVAPWGSLAKWVASLSLLMTPLGWFYHVTLFQVPGEIFFALLGIFLAAKILEDPSDRRSVALLGITATTWFLYRETALAPLLAILSILTLCRRWRAVCTVLLITTPVVLAWFMLFLPTSGYVQEFYGFTELTSRPLLLPQILLRTLEAIPSHLTPLGLAVLLGCSSWVALRGDRRSRLFLGLSWAVAVVNILGHVVIAIPTFAGYGRFAAFLLLPLSTSVALTASNLHSPWRLPITAGILTTLSLVTPWNIVVAANTRATLADNLQWKTMHPYAAFPEILGAYLDRVETMIAIGPEIAVLDLFIAEGKLTPLQRSAIVERSRQWVPGDPGSPVIVHDFTATTFAPPLHTDGRVSLSQIVRWIREQPGVRTSTIGGQTTYVLP